MSVCPPHSWLSDHDYTWSSWSWWWWLSWSWWWWWCRRGLVSSRLLIHDYQIKPFCAAAACAVRNATAEASEHHDLWALIRSLRWVRPDRPRFCLANRSGNSNEQSKMSQRERDERTFDPQLISKSATRAITASKGNQSNCLGIYPKGWVNFLLELTASISSLYI